MKQSTSLLDYKLAKALLLRSVLHHHQDLLNQCQPQLMKTTSLKRKMRMIHLPIVMR